MPSLLLMGRMSFKGRVLVMQSTKPWLMLSHINECQNRWNVLNGSSRLTSVGVKLLLFQLGDEG